MDPDDDPRGQPRLGRLGDGGLHRVRHRVQPRRRGRPTPLFGFAKPTTNGQPLDGTGRRAHQRARGADVKHYTPPKGGIFDLWGGNTGTKVQRADRRTLAVAHRPRERRPGRVGGPGQRQDGTLRHHRRAGRQLHADAGGTSRRTTTSTLINVTVERGERPWTWAPCPLNGWWTEFDGYVFDDTNRNGVQGPGREGRPQLHPHPAQARELADGPRPDHRHDRRQRALLLRGGYPRVSGWSVMEAYNDATTRPESPTRPTTRRSRPRSRARGVDVSMLPHHRPRRHAWTGASTPTTRPARNGVDPRNGGIVGTVSYDMTRNELDPQYAASEDWQPGISGVPVKLYATVDCGTDGRRTVRPQRPLRARPRRLLRQGQAAQHLRHRVLGAADRLHRPRRRRQPARALADNAQLRRERPGARTRRRTASASRASCRASSTAPTPTDQGTPDANFGAAVNGNYGFGDGCFNGTLDATTPTEPRLRRRRRSRRSAPATTSSQVDIPRTTRPASRCTRSPAKRTSTSATATRSCRRCRRRPAPALCTPSTSSGDGDRRLPGGRRATATNDVPVGRDRAGLDPGRQRRRSSTSAARRTRAAAAAVRHQARERQQRQVDRADVQRVHRRADPGRAARRDHRRPQLLRPTRARSCTARRPASPFAPVGIYDFANRLAVHDRDRLQRHLRRADAVHQPHQLPDALRRVREHVPRSWPTTPGIPGG